jgi:hypothetical protein
MNSRAMSFIVHTAADGHPGMFPTALAQVLKRALLGDRPGGISEMKLQKKEKTVEAKIVKGQLVITLPLQTPARSASGKTLIVASSHGVKRSALKMEGKELCVVANAFIYPSSPDEKGGKKSPVKPKR